MAEVTSFSFDLREVTIALIKQQGLHEGKWTLGVEFGLAAAVLGPTPDESRPSAIVQVQKLQLTRPQSGLPEFPFVVDAAVVNPRPK